MAILDRYSMNWWMSRDLRVSYVFATAVVWEQIELSCEELGWTRAGILRQAIHGFMGRHGRFYADCGLRDAEARGLTESAYYEALRDGNHDNLPRYVTGHPGFGRSPLTDTPLVPQDEENRRRYSIIALGNYNYVLLRVAHIVEGDSLVQTVSRIIACHFDENWETRYLPQIARDKANRFLLEDK